MLTTATASEQRRGSSRKFQASGRMVLDPELCREETDALESRSIFGAKKKDRPADPPVCQTFVWFKPTKEFLILQARALVWTGTNRLGKHEVSPKIVECTGATRHS